MLKYLLSLSLVISSLNAQAAEATFKGVIDLRVSYVDGVEGATSYLKGGYGKFRFDDGASFSLGQLGLQHHLSFENNWSTTLVVNGFSEQGHLNVGVTEAFVKYKGLPNQNGWRFSGKIGLFYPKISLENIATAWSTPYSITSSSLNNWVGEEFRNTGVEFSVEKLGKFSRSSHNFGADISLFINNDPAGAMIAWHGWTIGSRQTLLQEKLVIPEFPALQGGLSAQAPESDPFLELDDRWGAHFTGFWRYKNKFKVTAGYYDNHAEEGLVEKGQYTWTTYFSHLGIKAKIAQQVELIGQYMQGSTFMTSPYGTRVVDNDFHNGYVMVRKHWHNHQVAVRAEFFGVDDLDTTLGDNNDESGKGLSLAYRFKLSRNSFLFTEYNWIQSNRSARWYYNQPTDLIEKQYQLAYKYFF